jgi:enamine deaminase RidA (YjgF/YER057c/UK114 family)
MGTVTYLNPASLPHNPAFSYGVRVEEPAATIYIGGQNGIRPDGTIAEGMQAQSEQALLNLQAVLEEAGASLENVVKWTIAVAEGQPIEEGIAAFRKVWGDRPNPPAITVHIVAGTAVPAFVVEIDAVAVVPR